MDKRLKPNKPKRNLSYRRNTRKIQKAFMSLDRSHRWHITLKEILDKTKLSKKTLYIHYPDIDDALSTIEQELLQEFEIEIDKSTKTFAKILPDNNRRFFYVTMLYMSKNKEVFTPICKDIANYMVLHRMIEKIYPMLDITWYPVSSPAPSIGSERTDLFVSMCVAILSRWGHKTGCDINKAEKYLGRLTRFTNEASMRCR